jgi:alkylated DNA repair dioxygenase AlkB
MGEQLFLFESPKESDGGMRLSQYDLGGGAIIEFTEGFIQSEKSEWYFQRLLKEIEWQQDYIRLYGKSVRLPRLTAWYGDRGSSYNYSGIGMNPSPWTDLLLELKNKVESASECLFNSVLLNLYRDGGDGVAWHRDNEHELGPEPTIASLSFGFPRPFQFRHKFDRTTPKFELLLSSGSFLIMRGTTQQYWEHQIPKTKRKISSRINLTFRRIGEPYNRSS